MGWFQILCVRHRCDGMVVEIEPGHGAACDAPCSCMLGTDGFQVRFKQLKGVFWVSIFDAGGCCVDQSIDVNFRLDRFGNRRLFRLRLFDFSQNVLLSNHHFGGALKFVDGECCIFVVVVVDGFVEQIFRVFDARFFCDFFHECHVDFLSDLDRGLHCFHGHGNVAVLASFLKSDQGWVAREEIQCLTRHRVCSLKVANSLQEDGQICRSGSVFLVQIKTDLEGLACPTSILLSFEQDAPIEPRHVARWVEGDGLVERCKGAFDITTTAAFFTDGEQHLNHFLGVFHLFKFGNNVPWRLRWFLRSRGRLL